MSVAKLTPAYIESRIAEHHYSHLDGTTLTVCTLILRNGFTCTGTSACIRPEDFDADMGRSIARQKALDQVWQLEGYLAVQMNHVENNQKAAGPGAAAGSTASEGTHQPSKLDLLYLSKFLPQNDSRGSITGRAKAEMELANFGNEESARVLTLIHLFLESWDSGGAVAAMQPVITRLISGQPLTPLTGEPDEWGDMNSGVRQNKRYSALFWNADGTYLDLENPNEKIEFPYTPQTGMTRMPVFTIQT